MKKTVTPFRKNCLFGNLFQNLAVLQIIIIVMEAMIDQAMDATSSAILGRKVRTETTL